MQISQIKQVELALLITGLRAIHVSNSAKEKRTLLIQLENEMSTRFGMMIGKVEEQERNAEDYPE